MPGFGGFGNPPAFGAAFPNAAAGGQMPGAANMAGMGQQQGAAGGGAAGAGGAMQATPPNSPYAIAPQVFSQDAIQVPHPTTNTATTFKMYAV